MNPAKQAAIELIEYYVKRGDSLQSLMDGLQGVGIPNGMSVSIGGYLPPVGHKGNEHLPSRKTSCRDIAVRRDVNGKEVNVIFKLEDIYNEIKQGQTVLL